MANYSPRGGDERANGGPGSGHRSTAEGESEVGGGSGVNDVNGVRGSKDNSDINGIKVGNGASGMNVANASGKDFVLTIDQSTSGTKALVIGRDGRIVARADRSHRQLYPAPGWVEHDPAEIYRGVVEASREALRLAGAGPERLAALTITNQRETAVLWDRETGQPVYNAIVWQCQRTAEMCEELKSEGRESLVRERTGLMLDPYFSATKWSWMLRNAPGADRLLAKGRLLAGTIDSWLLWKLTGGRVHATDYTNASRTSLFDIRGLHWDEELCELFGVPIGLLPEAKPCDAIFGYAVDPDLFGTSARVPIAGVVGDSQAALFGQSCFEPGMAKATYGTGTSVLMNIGEAAADPGGGLVLALAWSRGGRTSYALEAVIRTSGDSVKWVRDNLGLFETFAEVDRMLAETPDNEGVYLVPAFVGLGAPYWDAGARAAIVGMNRGTGKSHIVRAAIESIAYQVRDAAELMETESGVPLAELRADGGASNNEALMRFQADMLGRPVRKSAVEELSALGSAAMGGAAVGFWRSPEEALGGPDAGRLYAPSMSAEQRDRRYRGWQNAVASVLSPGRERKGRA